MFSLLQVSDQQGGPLQHQDHSPFQERQALWRLVK
jgi:hypothetical protein